MTVARVALPIAAAHEFDYWIPAGLDVRAGSIVRAQLARRVYTGVVVAVDDTATIAHERLQPIAEVVAFPPVPAESLAQAAFVAAYYQEPLGLVLAHALPPLGSGSARRSQEHAAPTSFALTAAGRATLPSLLARAPSARALFERMAAAPDALAHAAFVALTPRHKRTLRGWIDAGHAAAVAPTLAPAETHPLNDAQREAAGALIAAHGAFAPFVLQGVAGSGKTEVYLAAAAQAIAAGGQVLMLAPEINLTPQLEARVRAALPGAVWSRCTAAWRQANGAAAGSPRRTAARNSSSARGSPCSRRCHGSR